MTEHPKEKLLRDILDEEVDRPNDKLERSSVDRRIKYERRVMAIPKMHSFREGVHAFEPAPQGTTQRWTREIIRFLQMKIVNPKVETMVILLLDQTNMLIDMEVVGVGTEVGDCQGRKGVIIRPRRIFEILLHPQHQHATGFILAHNHPSGDSMPSEEDYLEARRIKTLGEWLDCKLKDFLIIGLGDHFSLKNETYEL